MPEIHSIKHKKTGTVYGIADDVVREQLTEKERTGMLSNLLSDAWINGPLTPALEAAVSGLSEPEEESGEEPEEAWDDEGSYDESDG